MNVERSKRGRGATRRHVLAGAGALALVGAAAREAGAQGAGDFTAALNKAVGGGQPKDGKVIIVAPEIAENGATVPVTLVVDSPMTPASYVVRITLLADGNPSPEVAEFRLTPLSGKAEVSIRIRLAKTQNLVAVAEFSDKSLWTAKKEVKVTIGGCGG